MTTTQPPTRTLAIDLSASGGLGATANEARIAHEAGCRGLWITETGWDPFLPAVPAFDAADSLEVGTGIAIAFARNPMTLAQQAHDLHAYSNGRFVLGLGSQIKPHITKRFSMPWGQPVPQMREMISAIRAIWAHWYDGATLDFRGEYYSHTFNAEPFRVATPPGLRPPPIYLAAVGPRMAALAGELADGFIAHALVTESYLRNVLLPKIAEGRALRTGTLPHPLDDGFQVALGPFIATGQDAEIDEGLSRARQQIAFYGSTPAYRPVLDHHGLGDLHEELHRLSKAGRWDEMPALIDDSVLSLFAVTGQTDEVAREIRRRYGDAITRLRLPVGHSDLARLLATDSRTSN